MTTGNAALIDIIRAEIRKRGPQLFAWFMQQALYHPEHGYYSSGRCAIGRHGDYFTNVSVGPLLGQLLGVQFAEIWERLGKTERFTIVEQGAHDGQFARDVLDSVQKRAPEFFAALRYQIVEPFPFWRDRQQQMLESCRDKVEWQDAIEPFVGIHFSNELLDAMPVRLLSNNGGRCTVRAGTKRRRRAGLHERVVALSGNEFVFVKKPVDEKAKHNQAALNWVDSVAANLQRGFVIAVDYGYASNLKPQTSDTPFIQVRAKHRHLDSPFEQIGYADITAHVDWSSIAERAKQNSLRVAGFTDQHHFLTGIISELGRGGSPELRANASPVRSDCGQSPLPDSPKIKRELQTLLHPEMLGRSFQVLALTKDAREVPPLAGFKFAREL